MTRYSPEEIAELDAAVRIASHNLQVYARKFVSREGAYETETARKRPRPETKAKLDQSGHDLELEALEFSRAVSRRCLARPRKKKR